MQLAPPEERYDVVPGQPFTFEFSVFNDSERIDAYSVEVELPVGVVPHILANHRRPNEAAADSQKTEAKSSFVDLIKVFPGQSGAVSMVITAPMSLREGRSAVSVRVRSDNEDTPVTSSKRKKDVSTSEAVREFDVEIDVARRTDWRMSIEPTMVRAFRSTSFYALFANHSNHDLVLGVEPADHERVLTFDCEPVGLEGVRRVVDGASVHWNVALAAGESRKVNFKSRSKWRLLGTPLHRVIATKATYGAAPPELEERVAVTTFLHRPVLPAWLLSIALVLLTLGILGSLALGVLSSRLDSLTGKTGVSSQCPVPAPDGSNAIQGAILEPDGSPAAGVRVRVMAADASGESTSADELACGFTDDDGRYAIPGAGTGDVTLWATRDEGKFVEELTSFSIGDETLVEVPTQTLGSPDGANSLVVPEALAPTAVLLRDDGSEAPREVDPHNPVLDGLSVGDHTLDFVAVGAAESLGPGQRAEVRVRVPIVVTEGIGPVVPPLPEIGNGAGLVCGFVTDGTNRVEGAFVRAVGSAPDGSFTVELTAATVPLLGRVGEVGVASGAAAPQCSQMAPSEACTASGGCRTTPGFMFGGLPTPAVYEFSTISPSGAVVSTTVDLTTALVADGIELVVAPGMFTLVGRVDGGDGVTVNGATVVATNGTDTGTTKVQSDGACPASVGGPPEKTQSGRVEAPCFSLAGLPAVGAWVVTISGDDFEAVTASVPVNGRQATETVVLAPITVDPITVDRSANGLGLKLDLGWVRGRIASGDVGASGLSVVLANAAGESVATSVSDDEGSYFLEAPPGEYTVTVAGAVGIERRAVVVAGQTVDLAPLIQG